MWTPSPHLPITQTHLYSSYATTTTINQQSAPQPPPSKLSTHTTNNTPTFTPILDGRTKINLSQLQPTLNQLSLSTSSNTSATTGLPLNFPSEIDELGFTFLLDALNFGTGYEILLRNSKPHKQQQRGIHETIQFGLLSMFISSNANPPYSADALVQTTPHSVSVTFDFPIHESQPVSFATFGGVYQDVDGPLRSLAVMFSQVMNELGMTLRARGFPTLGDFIMAHIPKCKSGKDLVSVLVEAFPVTFGDAYMDGTGQLIRFDAKARRTVIHLCQQFPKFIPFSVESVGGGPVVDAKLVAALRRSGMLFVENRLVHVIDVLRERLERGGNDELALRLGALKCLEVLVEGSDGISLFEMGERVIRVWGGENSSISSSSSNNGDVIINEHLCATMAY
jgi:hypothetical protein